MRLTLVSVAACLCWEVAAPSEGVISLAAGKDLWARCADAIGESADQPVRTRRFGETAEMTERLLGLIVSGEKTITATSPWLYESDPESKPVVGTYSVALDAAGLPRAILRTTAVKTVPFDAVTGEDSRYEGGPVRSIEAWRAVHWRFFTRVLAPMGKIPAPDMPVTLERFEVVCRAGDEG